VSADPTTLETVTDGVARVRWDPSVHESGHWPAVEVVRGVVDAALAHHERVEALVREDDQPGQRLATWAGLRREGIRRDVTGHHVVYARLATDVPVSEPEGFRALLNSFLPRKRAISQMLIRDPDGRVLLCQLTYKHDWDLPGGVVEVGESPRLAVGREVAEELGLAVEPGRLLLTDWLPAWSGWDDAVCLVFDGGVHDPSVIEQVVAEPREIRGVAWAGPDQVRAQCADFTARRVEAALRAVATGIPAYTESGRED
jgi:8-oxo-dGTP pyrophosphatase MutT (NUDIX family)